MSTRTASLTVFLAEVVVLDVQLEDGTGLQVP
jgi:hypothetical protein